MTIKEFMTQDHKKCDEFLSKAEEALDKSDIENAKKNYEMFKNETLKHFSMEEDYLFPMFEEKTGMTNGPTQVMRMEHSQARSLFEKLDDALNKEDKDRFFGLSESMMILLQQHNAKEEQMLYTMMQMHLGDKNDEIVNKLMEF